MPDRSRLYPLLRLALWPLLTLPAACAFADITLPPIISDNMVLQQNVEANVWGRADVGENVTVEIGGQSVQATTRADGRWALKLKGLKRGGPYEMTITGKNSLTIHNVAVGEVWLCAGEANMAMKVAAARHSAEEIATANYPMLRYFTVRGKDASGESTGEWAICEPDTVRDFSATAYFFGRELNQANHVPAGLIESTQAAASIKGWMPGGPDEHGGEIYAQKIAPLTRYPIRGALWYQGESDTGAAGQYAKLFPKLITGWKEAWGQDDFPFLYVQLAPFLARRPFPAESRWAELREAQAAAQSLSEAGMATAIDTGGEYIIHPVEKQEIGHRLFLLAEQIAYGRAGVAASGPTLADVKFQGGKAILSFQHAEGGLVVKNGEPLKGFSVAGADGKFAWAEAALHGNKVTLQSKNVPTPAAVRYGWADCPECHLYNKAGLPAPPFRTDAPRVQDPDRQSSTP